MKERLDEDGQIVRGRGGRNVFSSLRSLLFISPLHEPADYEEWREKKGGVKAARSTSSLLSPYISLSIVFGAQFMSRRTDALRS